MTIGIRRQDDLFGMPTLSSAYVNYGTKLSALVEEKYRLEIVEGEIEKDHEGN